jgi:hypothetical protein
MSSTSSDRSAGGPLFATGPGREIFSEASARASSSPTSGTVRFSTQARLAAQADGSAGCAVGGSRFGTGVALPPPPRIGRRITTAYSGASRWTGLSPRAAAAAIASATRSATGSRTSSRDPSR